MIWVLASSLSASQMHQRRQTLLQTSHYRKDLIGDQHNITTVIEQSRTNSICGRISPIEFERRTRPLLSFTLLVLAKTNDFRTLKKILILIESEPSL